jgi:hypothetical protein
MALHGSSMFHVFFPIFTARERERPHPNVGQLIFWEDSGAVWQTQKLICLLQYVKCFLCEAARHNQVMNIHIASRCWAGLASLCPWTIGIAEIFRPFLPKGPPAAQALASWVRPLRGANEQLWILNIDGYCKHTASKPVHIHIHISYIHMIDYNTVYFVFIAETYHIPRTIACLAGHQVIKARTSVQSCSTHRTSKSSSSIACVWGQHYWVGRAMLHVWKDPAGIVAWFLKFAVNRSN